MSDPTMPSQRGAYYLIGLLSRHGAMMREVPEYEKRLATLRRIGSPIADDHEALIAVQYAMLKVVEDAILAVKCPANPAEIPLQSDHPLFANISLQCMTEFADNMTRRGYIIAYRSACHVLDRDSDAGVDDHGIIDNIMTELRKLANQEDSA